MADLKSVQDDEAEKKLEEQQQKILERIRSKYRNKQRILILGSRNIIARYRHLQKDLEALMPHSKKEPKFNLGESFTVINEICETKNCNNCIFFECRKRKDLFLWMTKTPHGPTLKFQVLNVNTMQELKFTGNALKGSRPILSFDKSFDSAPHLQLMREMFTQMFSTPYMHPRSKPFVDHVFGFYILDDKIWFRNYEIIEERVGSSMEKTLREIGPRFVLNPVKILFGSFVGPVIWENPNYISPNKIRTAVKRKIKVQKAVDKEDAIFGRREKLSKTQVSELDPIDQIWHDVITTKKTEKGLNSDLQ